MTTLSYRPPVGTEIRTAIASALQLARHYNRPVRFRFNGQRIIATKRLSVRHLQRQWDHSNAAARLAYRRSAEGIAAAEESASEVDMAQQIVDALIRTLPNVTTLDGMMAWLHGFTDPADRVGVSFDNRAVAAEMEKMGFVENEGVGHGVPPTSEKMGRYIVGQAMNCLRNGHAPHGVTHRFIQDYLALKKRETAASE